MIFLGLGLGVFFHKRFGSDWRLYAVGAATFVGSQVLHIPFNAFVLSPALGGMGFSLSDAEPPALLVIAAAFGLSAGIFEETARLLVYRLWLKQARSWRLALMFGAGHGGAEAIITGAITLITVIQIIALRGTDLNAVLPAEQLELARAQIEAFWALPWYAVLLGAFERAVALSFHLSAAVLVLQVYKRRSLMWYGLAVGWHTLLNAAAVFASQRWGLYATEGILVFFALGSIWIVFALREEGIRDENPPPPPQPPPLRLSQIELSREALEESRYD